MDITSKLLAWEGKLEEFHKIIAKFSAPRTQKKTRGTRRQASRQTLDCVEELKGLLAGLVSELQDIRRDLSHPVATNGNDATSSAAALTISKQTDLPAQTSAKPLVEKSRIPQSLDVQPYSDPTPLSKASETVPDSARPPLFEANLDPGRALPSASSIRQAEIETPATARPKFSLTVKDMGENFIPNISGMVNDENFAGKIRVEDLPEVDWAGLKSMQPKDRKHLGVQYSRGPNSSGYCFVKLSTSTRFVIPGPPQGTAGPSDDEAIAYLDEIANNPPSTTKAYYAGPSISSKFGSLLHPGEALASIGPIAGGNSPYDYIGESDSATRFHRDDANLWSCNLVGSGWKLWLVIPQEHTKRFEYFIRCNWEANHCNQFVGHLSLFVGPTRLQAEGIDFVIHCAGPGDMIIIKPGQYHAVVNYSTCFATSINFTLPGEPVMPPDLAVCEQCGLYSLGLPGFRMVSPPVADKVPEPELGTKTTASVTKRAKLARRPAARQTTQPAKKIKTVHVQSDLDLIVQQVLKIDDLCNIPHINKTKPPSPEVLKLALAISSRPAVQQFCNLVRSRREPNNGRARLQLSKDLQTRIGERLRSIGVSQRRSTFERFLVRLDQYYLAQEIETSKDGRIHADGDVLGTIAKAHNIAKKELQKQQKIGNKWKRICGDRKELLCLIFLSGENPFGIYPVKFTDLDSKAQTELHDLLNCDNPYISSLCSTVADFVRSVDDASYEVEFLWEAKAQSPEIYPETEMLGLLRPTILAENLYTPEKYPDWPRPPGWPEDSWPADPTRILCAEDKKCDFCEATECACLYNIPKERRMPHIKEYGDLGRGLQAVADSDGQVAYRKGDVIGFLTGEIVPAGTFNDGQTLDFARPDLEDEPVVCQIRCAEVGNRFRLLNHACRPTARLKQMRASGKFMTAVEAIKDISDGEQITVSYGSKWNIDRCLCDTCRS